MWNKSPKWDIYQPLSQMLGFSMAMSDYEKVVVWKIPLWEALVFRNCAFWGPNGVGHIAGRGSSNLICSLGSNKDGTISTGK